MSGCYSCAWRSLQLGFISEIISGRDVKNYPEASFLDMGIENPTQNMMLVF